MERFKEHHGYYPKKPVADGRIFDKYIKDVYDTTGEKLQIRQIYEEPRKCEGCPFRNECLKNPDGYKTVSRNIILEEFRKKVDENLKSEEGKELCRNSSVQVEGTFGIIKQDAQFTRFTTKGMKNIEMEFLLVCLGVNFRKYHQYRIKNSLINNQLSQKKSSNLKKFFLLCSKIQKKFPLGNNFKIHE